MLEKIKIMKWEFETAGVSHRAELRVWSYSGRAEFDLDGRTVWSRRFAVLRTDREYPISVTGAEIKLEINSRLPMADTEENDLLRYDCYIDGKSLNFGTRKRSKEDGMRIYSEQEKSAWQQTRAKGFARYLLKAGLSISYMALLCLCVVFVLYFIRIVNLERALDYVEIGIPVLLLSSLIEAIYTWSKNNRKYGNQPK